MIRRLGGRDPGAQRQLETIDREAGKLARLVDQLLDVSRIQEGRLSLDRRPADLVDLVEDVAAVARWRTERHEIAVSRPSRLQAVVDALRLEQVLVNLLDNAMRYSPDGGRIELTLSEPEPSTVEIAVRDHGSGTPTEKRARIFERFYQAHTEDYASGMGLGLYISRQIVELHAGTIRAEFPEDGGTRFVIHVPCDSEQHRPAPAPA